jgi:hypothetical protein
MASLLVLPYHSTVALQHDAKDKRQAAIKEITFPRLDKVLGSLRSKMVMGEEEADYGT